jgi:acetyl-CoA carboxylase biotin carboxyl carrier protein
MKKQELEQLVQKMRDTGYHCLHVEDKNFELELSLNPASSNTPPQDITTNAKSIVEDGKNENLVIIKAERVGRFYSTQTSDKTPPIRRGDTIKKGQHLCMIEAMNIEHVVVSPVDGIFLGDLVDDGDPVMFGQSLLKIGLQ